MDYLIKANTPSRVVGRYKVLIVEPKVTILLGQLENIYFLIIAFFRQLLYYRRRTFLVDACPENCPIVSGLKPARTEVLVMTGGLISKGQLRALTSKFVNSVPDNLDFEIAQEWCDCLHEVMPQFLRNYRPLEILAALECCARESAPKISESTAPSYPANDVEFELSINEPFTGLDMVRWFGYVSTGWKFNGTEITQPIAKRFKLVSVRSQFAFSSVETANAKLGIIPEGQWLEVFRRVFPQSDYRGPVGIARASWVHPNGMSLFPCLYRFGDARFNFISNCDFGEEWRWLVEVRA